MLKRDFIRIIILIMGVFFFIAMVMIVIAPYFHYHKPLKGLKYSFLDQRYTNDGIIRNFDYDAIIIGTSMTENFKVSQFNTLFKVNSIKVPFAGGGPKEINDTLERALKKNKNLKLVLRGIDYSHLLKKASDMNYNDYPEYLYDDNVFNDYKYILNKKLIINSLSQMLINTINKTDNLDFDRYSNWSNSYLYGKEVLLKNYVRNEKEKKEKNLNEVEKNILLENIKQNFLKLPLQYPEVHFIYFITPYSILYWDGLNQSKELVKQFEIEKIFLEEVFKVKNIEIYSFFNDYSMITNLENYKDPGHYSGEVNEKILKLISENKFQLTATNYKSYLKNNQKFYKNFDYDKIFQSNEIN